MDDGFPYPVPDTIRIRDTGYLPHWETDDAIYFVTFRLADSLPHGVLKRIQDERDCALARLRRTTVALPEREERRVRLPFSEEIDGYLDRGVGACWLSRPDIAGLVRDTICLFESKRYRLFAWCLMPNHAHIILRTALPLARILHSWKSYTAKEANRLLCRRGAFWQREYYDNLVRDGEELARVIHYTIENPKKAGLQNWPWVWQCGEGDSPSA